MEMYDLAATGRSAVMSNTKTSILIAAQSDRKTPDLALRRKSLSCRLTVPDRQTDRQVHRQSER